MQYQLIWGLMLGLLLLPDSEALSFMLLNQFVIGLPSSELTAVWCLSTCIQHWISLRLFFVLTEYPLEIINSFSFSYQIHNFFHFSWLYVGRYTLSFICINLMTCPWFHLISCCYFFFSLMLNDSTVAF